MIVDKIALILVIVGALNWGGVGLFGFDTVAFLFGGQAAVLSRIVYALVGLAGLWCVTLLFRDTEDNTGHAPPTAWAIRQKRAPYGALFSCHFPACRRFTKSSAGVTLTVR